MINVSIRSNTTATTAILSENTTLREALEQNNVDYSIGTTSLDGCTLRPGDLDRSFSEFGITERCFLMVTVKIDNAAKVSICGNAIVIESDFTIEQLAEVQKYRPNALVISDPETKAPVFAVGVGRSSINKYGIEFEANSPTSGKASMTVLAPAATDPKDYFVEKYGAALLSLKKIESGIAAQIEDIAAEREQVIVCITVC